MTLNVKTLDGSVLEVSYDYSMTVRSLKMKIAEHYQIDPRSQRVIFAGKQLENDRLLVDYSVTYDTTVHMIPKHLEKGYNFEESAVAYHWVIRNFAKLRRLRKEGNHSVLKRVEDDGLFVKYICPGGKFGPLSIILSFIDPIELLFNFIHINKTFYESVWCVLETPSLSNFQPVHFHVLFGRYTCVSETLFMKLIGIIKERNNTDPQYLNKLSIFYDVPNHYPDRKPRNSDTILNSCASRNYFTAFKYLIHEINMKPRPGLVRTCYFYKRYEILDYLLNNFSGFIIDSYITERYIKKDGKNFLDMIKVICDTKKDPPNNTKDMRIFEMVIREHSYLAPLSVSFFKAIEEYDKFDILKFRYSITNSLKSMDWDLVKYCIMKKDSEDVDSLSNADSTGIVGELERLFGRQFYEFLMMDKNHEKLKFDIYLPRFQLYLACMNAKKKEDIVFVRKMLSQYDRDSDFHFTNIGGGYSFLFKSCHFKYNQLFAAALKNRDGQGGQGKQGEEEKEEEFETKKNIVRLLIDSGIPFNNQCYLETLYTKNFEVVDTFFSSFLKTINDSDKQTLQDCIIQEIRCDREQKALSLYQKYYKSKNQGTTYRLNKLFELSLKHEMKKLSDEIMKSWIVFYPNKVARKFFFQLLSSEKNQEYNVELAIRLLSDFSFQNDVEHALDDGKRSMWYIFRLCIAYEKKEICECLFVKPGWKEEYIVHGTGEDKINLSNGKETIVEIEKMQKFVRQILGDEKKIEMYCFDCKKKKIDVTRENFIVVSWVEKKGRVSRKRRGRQSRKMICLECHARRKKEFLLD